MMNILDVLRLVPAATITPAAWRRSCLAFMDPRIGLTASRSELDATVKRKIIRLARPSTVTDGPDMAGVKICEWRVIVSVDFACQPFRKLTKTTVDVRNGDVRHSIEFSHQAPVMYEFARVGCAFAFTGNMGLVRMPFREAIKEAAKSARPASKLGKLSIVQTGGRPILCISEPTKPMPPAAAWGTDGDFDACMVAVCGAARALSVYCEPPVQAEIRRRIDEFDRAQADGRAM